MPSVRPPAVAGQFYPSHPGALREMVEGFLEAGAPGGDTTPKALIAPHAGYVYSGPVAATAYLRLLGARSRIERVVLLGPSHRVTLRGVASSTAEAFMTPLGPVPVDREAVASLEALRVQSRDDAHALEHSLEVHLPFLQIALNRFSVVPLVVGDAPAETVAAVLETLWGGPETLIVVSSDLSHYHDYETARRIDAETSAAIEARRYEDIEPDRACGAMPLKGLLMLAARRELQVRALDVRSSGDTAGPRTRVVGYGAYTLQ